MSLKHWLGSLLGVASAATDPDDTDSLIAERSEAIACLEHLVKTLASTPVTASDLWTPHGTLESRDAHIQYLSSPLTGVSGGHLAIDPNTEHVVSITIDFHDDSAPRLSDLEAWLAVPRTAPPPARPDPCAHTFTVTLPDPHPIALRARVQTKPGPTPTRLSRVAWVTLVVSRP